MATKSNKLLSTSLNIDNIFYHTSIAKSLSKNFEDKLKMVGSSEDPQAYASRFLFFLLISFIVAIMLITISIKPLLIYKAAHQTKFAILGIILLIIGTIIPVITYLSLESQLSQTIERRRIGIDAEMGVFSSVFVIFLRSGLNPRLLFENLTKVKALRYISSIASYISKRMKYLGESTEEAIENSIKTSPSKLFKDYMNTYISATRTGAPVLETMEAKTKDVIKQIELNSSIATDRLSGIAETYVIWLASGYITFFLLIILNTIFPTAGLGGSLPMLGALLVILVPLINLIFTYMVDQTQFKFPEPPLSAYKYFYISLGLGLVLTFLVLAKEGFLIPLLTLNGSIPQAVKTSTILTIGLIGALTPPTVITYIEIKKGTGFDNYTVNFLRAIAEGLRAGLGPETVIKNIKDSKEMGKLSTLLRQIYVQTRLGVTLKDAIEAASKNVRDFSTRISLMMLGDMIEIGSMTPESIEILAEQIDTQIRIKNEYISKTRPLLYAPYVGIVLALIASVLLAFSIYHILLSESSALAYGNLANALILLPRAIYIIMISAVFNSFLAGFLIGKLSAGRVANGFLHSILLLIITLILMFVMIHIRFAFAPTSPPSL